MAKKKGKFHGIHISPKAGTHYEVRHEPVQEPAEGKQEMPTMGGDDEKHEKLFAHDQRGQLHQHIDDLMDAHEGKGGSEPGGITPASELPPDHPIHNLKRRMM